jgi:hypothetical protein
MASLELNAYLEEAASERWQWGEMDCTLFAANWVRRKRCVDPGARYRGKYASADEARAILKEAGGLRFVFREGLEDLGFVETHDPQDGDVGVILAPLSLSNELPVCGTIGAIRCGGLWIARAARGIRGGQFEHLAAWAI